ncbi:glycosyl hydrolase family 18 protein [Actinoplanes sp. NPDC051411]|uniref:glycoside hydrolase family 18 protein n=1 Tax=Actinoplanes sp. NPDC051411 TaxID=3155522 RepID=UPI0034341012
MRLRAVLAVLLLLSVAACTAAPPQPAPTPAHQTRAAARVVGYFTDWGVYARDYQVKDVETSGSAAGLTDLVYAFGQVKGGACAPSDAWADYQKPMPAAASVDGVADDPKAAVKGDFGQLIKLKARHPGLRLIWSFGGWNGSDGFDDAARDPAAFASSCRALLQDSRWRGLFDGIDIDWEYPNACGITCDKSGPDALGRVLGALRTALGPNALVTAAVPADIGKLRRTDYAAAARSANWLSAMTYDYFGTSSDDGGGGDPTDLHRTEPHSPLTAYAGIPKATANTSSSIDELLSLGVPASKLLLGIGFYGRGWTGVTGAGVGSAADGPAAGKYEQGLEEYELLVKRCPPTGTVGGTAIAHCGSQWWSYDTPETIRTKMTYVRSKALGGAFAWELSGDTADGVLLKAVASGLNPES